VALSDPLDANKGPKIQQVMDELWPDLEAKDPKGSFDTTLFRLRKLLGVEDAIQLIDGRLLLNRKRMWCDVFAFVHYVQNCRCESAAIKNAAQITDLYKGALFGAGNTFTWSISARERLSALFSEVVSALGEQFEAQGNYRDAIRIYEQALQQDNLIEPFYRGQMRCYLALGESAEALRAYRRCKEILSIVLGLGVTRETEVLRQQLA
jgi:LuxR family transcriptional regulator, maltose regulon positive regulatory protein